MHVTPALARWLVDVAYLLVAFLFIMGLKRMSSPVSARAGILWAGFGMLIATVVTSIGAGGKKISTPERTAHMVLGAVSSDLYFTTAYFAIRAPRYRVRPAAAPFVSTRPWPGFTVGA